MSISASPARMNTGVSHYEIEASQDLLAMLAICMFTAQRIADGDDDAASLSGDIARTLRWARSLAEQAHHAMEMAERIGRTGMP